MSSSSLGIHAYRTLIEERRAHLRVLLDGILAGGGGSFVWEVGCGHGHFLTDYATINTNNICIGIDIESSRIARAERKRERAGLSNLHFIHADAADFLAALPASVGLSTVFILFPDPWPKRRHHKNRLMTPAFLNAVAGRIQPGARLCFRTDYEPYFRAVRHLLVTGRELEEETPDSPTEAPTEVCYKNGSNCKLAIYNDSTAGGAGEGTPAAIPKDRPWPWRLVDPSAWPFERPTVFQARAETYHSLVAERI